MLVMHVIVEAGARLLVRRTRFLLGMFIATIALACAASLAYAAESFHLRCALSAASGEQHDYAFRIEIPTLFGASRVTWVGINTHNLDVVRLDETMIIANLGTRLARWPDGADMMQFSLNRLTGHAEVDYLKKPEKGDNFYPIMQGLTESGSCRKAERAF
jgi:hypothetical protein